MSPEDGDYLYQEPSVTVTTEPPQDTGRVCEYYIHTRTSTAALLPLFARQPKQVRATQAQFKNEQRSVFHAANGFRSAHQPTNQHCSISVLLGCARHPGVVQQLPLVTE